MSETEDRDLPAAVEHLRSILNGHLNDFAELLGVVGRINERVGRIEAIIQNKGNDMATNGLRTERVTLEITQFPNSGYKSPSEWPWEFFLRGEALTHGESVRVVEEVHFDDLAKVAMERDTAIRERDRLRHLLNTKEDECRSHHPWVHPTAAPAASVVPSVVRDMTEILRSPTNDQDAKHAALSTLVEAVCPGWRMAPAASGNGQAILDGSPAASGAAVDPVLRQARLRDDSRTKAYVASLDDASGAAGTDVAEIARLAFDAGWGSSREGFNGECSYDHLAPKESTFEGDGSEPYERLKRDSVARIMSEAASGAAGNSPGSPVSSEPVAWMCEWADHTSLYDSLARAEADADGDIVPQPLYAAPQAAKGWLTEEQRRLIEGMMESASAFPPAMHWHSGSSVRETLRIMESLLSRSTPPEVVLPECPYDGYTMLTAEYVWCKCVAVFTEALAAAGVTVKEVGR